MQRKGVHRKCAVRELRGKIRLGCLVSFGSSATKGRALETAAGRTVTEFVI